MVIKRICNKVRIYANSISCAKYVRHPTTASFKRDLDFYKRLSGRQDFRKENPVIDGDLSDLLEDIDLN